MNKVIILLTLISGIIWSSSGQWTYSNLITPKSHQGAAVLGTKAYFGGGKNNLTHYTLVEIYDAATGTWNRDYNLSAARGVPAAVSCGSKVFFAGGVNFTNDAPFSTVDIFDTLTQEWTVEQLSVPRGALAVVSHGNKVLFAGGAHYGQQLTYDIVDIYDIQTGQWSTAQLSEARDARTAAVVGDIAMFAGGFDGHHVSKRVDIYHFTTDTWSIDSLSVARECAAIAVIGNKVLIAGGMTADNLRTDIVDIYDANTGTWSTAALSFPRAFSNNLCAAVVGNKAFFAGGGNLNLNNISWTAFYDIIDIYDASTDAWTVDHLTEPLIEHAVAAAGNKLIVAGGLSNYGCVSKVEIYNVEQMGITLLTPESHLSVYPNPFEDRVTFSLTGGDARQLKLEVLNQVGQIVSVMEDNTLLPGRQELQWNAKELPAGVYFYRLTANGQRQTANGKLVKMR